jgi:hypothetical protein
MDLIENLIKEGKIRKISELELSRYVNFSRVPIEIIWSIADSA